MALEVAEDLSTSAATRAPETIAATAFSDLKFFHQRRICFFQEKTYQFNG